jgi:hypothetical protein
MITCSLFGTFYSKYLIYLIVLANNDEKFVTGMNSCK